MSEVAGYQLFSVAGGIDTFITDITSGTSYMVTGLNDATTVHLRRGRLRPGRQRESDERVGVCHHSRYGAAVGAGATSALALGTGTINLSWSASTDNVGVAGYTIFRNGEVLERRRS